MMPNHAFCNILLFIFIHQSSDYNKKDKKSFKDVQDMVESDPKLEPQKLGSHENSDKYRRTYIRKISNKGGHMHCFLFG